jgi:hypothetical protein
VPCSGSGIARRHPDIKWLRRAADLASFAARQARILDALWRTLAPGGKLLYVTCSVFPEENGAVIDAFARTHAGTRRASLRGRRRGAAAAGRRARRILLRAPRESLNEVRSLAARCAALRSRSRRPPRADEIEVADARLSVAEDGSLVLAADFDFDLNPRLAEGRHQRRAALFRGGVRADAAALVLVRREGRSQAHPATAFLPRAVAPLPPVHRRAAAELPDAGGSA